MVADFWNSNCRFPASHKRTFPLEFIDTMEAVHLPEGCFARPQTVSIANANSTEVPREKL